MRISHQMRKTSEEADALEFVFIVQVQTLKHKLFSLLAVFVIIHLTLGATYLLQMWKLLCCGQLLTRVIMDEFYVSWEDCKRT